MNFPLAAENHLIRLRGTERCQWGFVVQPWEAQVADASDLLVSSQLSPDSEKVPLKTLKSVFIAVNSAWSANISEQPDK